MAKFILAALTVAIPMISASALANGRVYCYDPRALHIRCPAGTEFKGWNLAGCRPGLVKGPICASRCFDPRLVRIKCEDGKTFQGWNKGNCPGLLVESAVCE